MTDDAARDRLTALVGELSSMIESDFAFLGQLLKRGVVTRSEFCALCDAGNVYARNEILLRLVLVEKTEEQCCQLIGCLEICGQQHVVNFIRRDSAETLTGVRPLDSAHLRAINANTPCLLETLDPSDSLLSSLAAVDVLTLLQRDDVRAGRTPAERVGKLLELMTRKSVADYRKFVDCLTSQNQGHVADMLRVDSETLPQYIDDRIIDNKQASPSPTKQCNLPDDLEKVERVSSTSTESSPDSLSPAGLAFAVNMKQGAQVCGLTYHEDRFFVQCYRVRHVSTFSPTSGRPLGRTTYFKDVVHSPAEIVVCERTGLLYAGP